MARALGDPIFAFANIAPMFPVSGTYEFLLTVVLAKDAATTADWITKVELFWSATDGGAGTSIGSATGVTLKTYTDFAHSKCPNKLPYYAISADTTAAPFVSGTGNYIYAEITYGAGSTVFKTPYVQVDVRNAGSLGTVYVSPTGNDTTGDGSSGNPYATIKKGYDSVADGGEVLLADGTYNETAFTTRTHSRLITVKPDYAGGATKQGPKMVVASGVYNWRGSYFSLEDIEVQFDSNVTWPPGFYIQSAKTARFKGCNIHYNTARLMSEVSTAFYADTGWGGSADCHLWVEGCHVHHCSEFAIGAKAIIRGSEVNEIFGDLFQLMGNLPQGCVLEGNYVHDVKISFGSSSSIHSDMFQTRAKNATSYSPPPYDQDQNVTIRYNRLHDHAQGLLDQEACSGIAVYCNEFLQYQPHQPQPAFKHAVQGSPVGTKDGDSFDKFIAHNTVVTKGGATTESGRTQFDFFQADGSEWYPGSTNDVKNVVFMNNILGYLLNTNQNSIDKVFGGGSFTALPGCTQRGQGVQKTGGAAFSGQKVSTFGIGEGDYVDVAGASTANLKLTSSSVFKGAGSKVIGVDYYIDGTPIPSSGVNLGANDTAGATNNPPTITTTPGTTATEGSPYSYDADATDPEGDTLTWSVVSGPAGLTINSSTGLVSWTPTSGQVGANAVTIRVTDGTNNVDQNWTITVAASGPSEPVISLSATAEIRSHETTYRKAVAEFTRQANTTAYSSGQVIGSAAGSLITFDGCAKKRGGGGAILTARLWGSASLSGGDFELYVFDEAPIDPSDASALALADTDRPIAILPFDGGSAVDLGGPSMIEAFNTLTGKPFALGRRCYACKGTSARLYGLLVARSSFTPASGMKLEVALSLEVN